jgi:hypothetical protein
MRREGGERLSLRAIALHGIYESNFCITNFKYYIDFFTFQTQRATLGMVRVNDYGAVHG